MANKREQTVKEEALKLGWDVLRSGWPDFLLYNKYTNEAIFLEVKSFGDCLSKDQKKMHKVLRQLGFDVRMIRVGKNTEKHRKFIKKRLET